LSHRETEAAVAACADVQRELAEARAKLSEARDMIQTRDDELESVYHERDAALAKLAEARKALAIYKDGFNACMEWNGLDTDRLEDMSIWLGQDHRMIGEEQYQLELAQLRAMNAASGREGVR
jgi:hypothetical protein